MKMAHRRSWQLLRTIYYLHSHTERHGMFSILDSVFAVAGRGVLPDLDRKERP